MKGAMKGAMKRAMKAAIAILSNRATGRAARAGIGSAASARLRAGSDRPSRSLTVPQVVILAVALLLPMPAGAATFTATVDHAYLSIRETFDYILSFAGAGEAQAPPDVSALAKDFEIVGRGRRERTDKIDGRLVNVEEWITTLAPRRPGIFTLPSVTMNGLTTAPVKVQVLPALTPEEADERTLFARVDAGDAAPYAQGLVPVVVRIFDAVGIRGGGFGAPTADGAVLTAEGGQRTYLRTLGRRRYTVVEQSYLMQPQKSGRIEIDPVTVAVTLPGRASPADSSLANLLGRSPFIADKGEDAKLVSRPVAIEVKPRPEGAEGWFLPARGVSFTQEWSASPAKARVGVALTRTLRLKARGAGPNQLPTLPVAEVDGVRQYEDASRSERTSIDGEIGAELVQTISVVPTRAGRITLPAITVGWWNVDAARQEQASLPPVVIEVGSDTPAAAPPAPAGAAPSTPPPAGLSSADPGLAAPGLADMAELARRHGRELALAIAVLSVAMMLAGWLRRRRRRPAPAPIARARVRRAAMAPAYPDAAAAEQALQRAAQAGEAQATHAAFLAWLRLCAGDGGAALQTPQMKAALRDLSLALYGAEASPWRGRDFLSAFRREKRARRRAGRKARGSRLAPLYPAG